MLKRPAVHRGLTLIELVVGMTIAALLLGVGVPSFIDWIRNTRIRTAAEAIQSGLQLARAEAVRRNTAVRFQFTDTLTAACLLSGSGGNWVISLGLATGKCDVAPADPPVPPAQPDADDPYIIQVRPAAEGSANTVVAAGHALLIFNGLGRLTTPAATNVNIDIGGQTGTCIVQGGSLRCLRVVVSTDGQVGLCDPAAPSGQPRAC